VNTAVQESVDRQGADVGDHYVRLLLLHMAR